jgi:hypothetical protein
MSVPGRIPGRLFPVCHAIAADYDSGMNYATLAVRYSTNKSAISAVIAKHGHRRGPNDLRSAACAKRRADIAAARELRKAAAGDTDRSYRARIVSRRWCSEQQRPCCMMGEGHCQTCAAEHTLESVVAGASSGWDVTMIGAGR